MLSKGFLENILALYVTCEMWISSDPIHILLRIHFLFFLRIHFTQICCCCCCLVISDSCDPVGCSPPGSSVQARIMEWVGISFFRGSSQHRDGTCISCTDRWILYPWAIREAVMQNTDVQKDAYIWILTKALLAKVKKLEIFNV